MRLLFDPPHSPNIDPTENKSTVSRKRWIGFINKSVYITAVRHAFQRRIFHVPFITTVQKHIGVLYIKMRSARRRNFRTVSLPSYVNCVVYTSAFRGGNRNTFYIMNKIYRANLSRRARLKSENSELVEPIGNVYIQRYSSMGKPLLKLSLYIYTPGGFRFPNFWRQCA